MLISTAIRRWIETVGIPSNLTPGALRPYEWNAAAWEHLGDAECDKITPLMVQEFQQLLIRGGFEVGVDRIAKPRLRTEVNRQHRLFLRVCKWLVVNEVMTYQQFQTLKLVEVLAKNRSKARERTPIPPVDEDLFLKSLDAIPNASTRGLLMTLRLTGMRPSEGCVMHRKHIDFTSMDYVWVYAPPDEEGSRKNGWRDKQQLYFFGPKVQKIIQAELDKKYLEDGPVFRSSHFRPYSDETLDAYLGLRLKLAGLPIWHPSQLRKNWSNEVFYKYGTKAEAASLGHTEAVARREYLMMNRELAARIARDIG